MSYFGIPIRNGLPIGLGSVAPLASGGGSPFSPLSLFSGGAPGAWYDPSDYTTLFQDSAGTTPVTAVEQPVGLMLDKSQGLVLGSELVTNGDFTSAAGWTLPGTGTNSITGGKAVLSGAAGYLYRTNTSITAGRWYRVQFTVSDYSGSGTARPYLQASPVFGTNVTGNGTFSQYLLATTTSSNTEVGLNFASAFTASIDDVSIKELPGNHAFQATSASRPVLSARVNKLLATATLATQSVTTRAAAHTLRFEGAGSVTLTGTAIGVYTAGTHSITTTAGTLTLTVLGSVTSADLRETNDGVGVPAYQAVVTSTNYATTGFLPYLKFDGVDDSLSTNSISFTSTDKMSVFAGVRKLSDAVSALYETSANYGSNTGTFACFVNGGTPGASTTPNWFFGLAGTTGSGKNAVGYAAPVTNVLVTSIDISQATSATEQTLRINAAPPGTQESATSSAGTGNFGNYPLYIGRRNNASLPFNGQMYSMIIVGKAVTAGELSSTEKFVASKTGVTL